MAKFKEMTKPKKAWRIIWITLLCLLAAIIIYVACVFISYNRVPDRLLLTCDGATKGANTEDVRTNNEYKAISYNTGFGAYLPDYSFFMDGGVSSWAKSNNSVIATMLGIGDLLHAQNADFVSLQEVDSNSTRTYHIDETAIIKNKMPEFTNVTACCYKSPWLFWPLYEPHGASVSNLMTLSKYIPHDSIRYQFPVDESVTKILDYDRCYSKTYYTCDNGKQLVYYTTHMSAYSKDPSTSNKQIQQIVGDMQEEYNLGNYCICGADFNKQIVDNPEKYFSQGIVKETKPFPVEYLEGTAISVVAPFDEYNPVGTCRDAGHPLDSTTAVSNIDGFLITKNVKVSDADVIDTNYLYSDHNPVWMKFVLVS